MRSKNGEKAEPELRRRLLMIRLVAVDAGDECRLEKAAESNCWRAVAEAKATLKANLTGDSWLC